MGIVKTLKDSIANVIEEKKLVDDVDDKLKAGRNSSFEMQCYLNIAYYAGKQWLAYDKVNSRLFEPPKKPWKVRYTANRIQPIVRKERAKILKNKPVMWVAPASNEDKDIKSSKVADKAVEWMEYELKLQSKDNKLVLWGCTCSISFMKTFWNDGKGMSIPSPDGTETVKQGQVDCEVVSAFELKWDPSAQYWEDVQWCCHEKVRDVDYIETVYGVKVSPEQGIMNTNLVSSKLSDIGSFGGISEQKKMANAAIVKEYWEKPSSKYPNGRRITIANGKKLFYEEDIGFGPEDDTDRELPFHPFVHIDVPGKIEGTCVVEQSIPIQREYNKSRSQVIEYKNLMGSPIWTAQENSLVNGEPVNAPDYVCIYKAGMKKPQMETPPSMAADVYKNIEMCNSEFEYVSSQHETSNGQVPTGVKSGVAIGYLQEQDDTTLAPTISNFIQCKISYTRYLLKIIRFKYDIERTVNIVGKNRVNEAVTFKGSDITSTDVRVQEGSMYQLSRPAKQDFIMALVDKGLITDKTEALKMLDLGISDDVYDEYAIDVNDAQEENDLWKRGNNTPIVQTFDNHPVHINEHDKLRKSSDYDEMPPQLKQIIDEHVDNHKAMYTQMMPPVQQGGGMNQGM
jgi:hypothetical protein